MQAEFIAVGTELLAADHQETNSLVIQQMLREVGIDMHRKSVVRDEKESISSIFNEAKARSDLIIISGGLGPTVDDITAETLSDAMDKKLIFNGEIYQRMAESLRARGKSVNEGHRKQAYIIEGAEPLANSEGQAPGQYINLDNTHIILPGVPAEFEAITYQHLKPILQKINPEAEAIKKITFKFADIPESELNIRLLKIIEPFIENPEKDILITTKPGVQTVSLFFKISDEELMNKRKMLEKKLLDEFRDNLYASEDIQPEAYVGRMLSDRGLTLAVAESCTGGLLADRITNIPGASDYFIEGIVSYHNRAKENLLGVKKNTLEKHGAVSEQTAREMAAGLLSKSRVDIAVSITGIAGPSGGTEDKPVGTVFLGIADKYGINVEKRLIYGERRYFKEWVTSIALNIMRLRLMQYH